MAVNKQYSWQATNKEHHTQVNISRPLAKPEKAYGELFGRLLILAFWIVAPEILNSLSSVELRGLLAIRSAMSAH